MARRRKNKRQFFEDDSSGESAPDAGASSGGQAREQIESWSREAAEASGLQLFDVELVVKRRWIVRVYIDQPGQTRPGEDGIDVDDCAEVSRYLEAYMDAADQIPEDYVLEVSSPGIERSLNKPAHLKQAVGERIQLVIRQQVDGKNKVVGNLLAYRDDTLTVRLEGGDGEPIDIDWANVKAAQLKHDFDF